MSFGWTRQLTSEQICDCICSVKTVDSFLGCFNVTNGVDVKIESQNHHRGPPTGDHLLSQKTWWTGGPLNHHPVKPEAVTAVTQARLTAVTVCLRVNLCACMCEMTAGGARETVIAECVGGGYEGEFG